MDEYKNRPKTLSGQVKQAWLQHQFNILLGFGVRLALALARGGAPQGRALQGGTRWRSPTAHCPLASLPRALLSLSLSLFLPFPSSCHVAHLARCLS